MAKQVRSEGDPVMPDLPLIETERLILTVPTPDDAPRMLSYVLRNQEHFASWEQTRASEYYTLEYWSKQLLSVAEEFRRGESLRLILLDRENRSGPIQGQCTFSNIVRGPFQAAYLGYSLDVDAVGKGLMYEALTAAISYVFEDLNLHRVMANYIPSNERSARLLRRLGFELEGYALDYLQIAGKWQAHILTALINEEWKMSSSE
jgi:[ribosomal protein S5]-alanine N-acetyltransferase